MEDNKENLNKKSELALREEVVMQFWRDNDTFKKSLEKDAPKGNYVFYDGPPFATGLMHYGHILGSTAKDVIGRYQTMQGYRVPRKWGWDCHGLPIENIVEQELKIAGHVEIEALGIDKFVEHARSKVLEYDKEWEKGVERIGRWVDFKGGYKTMDNTFMESVWWALSELNKKELIYEGVRVLAYCSRCETPIANSEIAMDNSYKDITDISVYVKFELVDEPGTYLLAWTTTPWTLPGNTAIAINKEIEYVKVNIGNENFVLAKETLANVLKDKEYKIVEEIKGEQLVGKKYKPVFPYYTNTEVAKSENIWRVWHADFVTIEKGTGIAHEAPAFGEDDMNLAKAHDIPWIIHVDETGRFKSEVTDFAGMKVKPKAESKDEKDGHQKADIEVIKYLAHQNPTMLFAKEKIIHSYPHCMRCDTPIIYYALPSWFINIRKIKPQIVKRAQDVTWIPEHLKEGRFKHIVENAPDWNISRNRYWATPLPIWKCADCGNREFVSSLPDLKNKSKNSENKYFVMRHGGSYGNQKNTVSYKNQSEDHLTTEGEGQVQATAESLKDKNIDYIICSNFTRTKETAEIARKVFGLAEDRVIEDSRLRELDPGVFDGRDWDEYHNHLANIGSNWFTYKVEGGESLSDAKKRIAEALYEIESKYKGKNILFVTHGGPAWLFFVNSGLYTPEGKTYHPANFSIFIKEFERFKNAEVRPLEFSPLPHNKDFEIDMHRPYIDEIVLKCSCGKDMQRIPEVLDCWFESGSMPFAQDHFPFENADWQKNNFPAGFVAEYIGQVRTWFYYTHVVSTILFDQTPFKNVVTTGTVRAEDGQKMSKSKKNYPDPAILFNKYGVDALRIYLMSSPLMKGEDANFSEKLVQEISSKVVGRFFNVVSFYELFRDELIETNEAPIVEDVLNKWILSRYSELVDEVTKGMQSYDMAEAVRPLPLFIDDLSTWYLRRSRERIKDGEKDVKTETKQTLYFVLKNLAKIMAPFAPFTAEDVWLKLKSENDAESVHLTDWPNASQQNIQTEILEDMKKVRDIVSLGLEARQKAGIKVRQPLNKLSIQNFELKEEYNEMIQDELNVKSLSAVKGEESITVELDTNITPALKLEGDYRELVRGIQDIRKNMGLVPSDMVKLHVDTDSTGQDLINKFKSELLKVVGASSVEFGEGAGDVMSEIKVDELVFRVKLEK